jgi:hypothetical protein
MGGSNILVDKLNLWLSDNSLELFREPFPNVEDIDVRKACQDSNGLYQIGTGHGRIEFTLDHWLFPRVPLAEYIEFSIYASKDADENNNLAMPILKRINDVLSISGFSSYNKSVIGLISKLYSKSALQELLADRQIDSATRCLLNSDKVRSQVGNIVLREYNKRAESCPSFLEGILEQYERVEIMTAPKRLDTFSRDIEKTNPDTLLYKLGSVLER